MAEPVTRLPRKKSNFEPPPQGEAGRFLPAVPTDGMELFALWELPTEFWDSAAVKVMRLTLGSEAGSLVSSMRLADYDLGTVAGQYGPGRYRIQLAANAQQLRKNTNITVAQEFAAANGWGRAPIQPASQALALNTIEKMEAGSPVSKMEIGQMIEAAMQSAFQRMQPGSVLQQDPMQQMEKQLALLDMLETKAARMVERRMGMTPDAAPETETWASILKTAVPMLAPVLAQMLAPAPAPAQPSPQPQRVPKIIPFQQANPEPEPMTTPNQTESLLAGLTEEEKCAFGLVAGMLAPHVKSLKTMARALNVQQVAEQMLPFIPEALEESIVICAEAIQKDQGRLALIHPDLDTQDAGKWNQILQQLATALTPDFDPEAE